MATATSMEVSYSRKVQLDQFEPVNYSVTLDVDLDDEETPEEGYNKYVDRCEDMVERALAERIAQKKLDEDDDE